MTSFHLGLDLGGTNIKWVVLEVVGPSMRVLARGQAPTDVSSGEQSVVEQLIEIARDSSPDLIQSVGVGVPGLYDPVAGSTRFMPNVPGKWAGVPVAERVRAAVRAPTRLINDARAFTLAEHRLGAGRGADSMLGITLGTGVGGGLILSGRVEALWQLYVTFGLLVGLGVSCFYVPLTVTAIRWFEHRRGLAASIVSSGNGLGTLALAPLSSWLINVYDWRTAFLILGEIALLVVISMALLLRPAPTTVIAKPTVRSLKPAMQLRGIIKPKPMTIVGTTNPTSGAK